MSDGAWEYLKRSGLSNDERYDLFEIYEEECSSHSPESAWESMVQSVKSMKKGDG